MKKSTVILQILLVIPGLSGAQVNNEYSEILQHALAKSQEITIQRQTAELSLIDRQKARLTYLPSVTLQSSYTRLNDDISFSVPPIAIPVGPEQVLEKELDPIILQGKDIFRARLQAEMILFSGLQVPLKSAAAYHKYQAEQILTQREKAKIILETVEYYDQLALIAQSLEVLHESQKRLEKQKDYSQKAFQSGLASSYDLNKVKIAEKELEAKAIELKGNLNLVLLKLEQLTGLEKQHLKTFSPQLSPWPEIATAINIEQRAELEALHHGVEGLEKLRKSELAKYMPQVKAFANRELYEDDLSALDPTWYVGVGLQWSIFDGLQRHKDMQKINIQKNIKKLEKSHAEEQLNLNLAKSQEDLNTANKLLLLAREKRSDAMEGLEITMKGYQVGLNDITERLAAETDMQKAELELLQAIYQQRKASLKLIDATGQLSIENFTKEQ